MSFVRTTLAPAILAAMALGQIVFARSYDLSPWKGGGFGMFSTTDGTAFRYVRLFVKAPGRSEELAVAPSLEIEADRAMLFPSTRRLTSLAARAAARERRRERPVDQVTIEIWRVEFDAQLRATERRVRTFAHHVPTAPGGSR